MLSWPSWLAGGMGCSDCAVNEVDLSKVFTNMEDCRRPEGFGSMRSPRNEAAAQEHPVDEDRRLRDTEVTRIERELEDQKAKEQRRKFESEAREEAEEAERAKQQEVEQRRKAFNQRFRERREALERQAALRSGAEALALRSEFQTAQALRSDAEAQEATEDRGRLDAWLHKNGFAGVGAKKVTVEKTTYPLHEAVDQSDAEVVLWLLQFGANAEQQDSSGETPRDLAASSYKDGFYDEVLKAFQATSSNSAPREAG